MKPGRNNQFATAVVVANDVFETLFGALHILGEQHVVAGRLANCLNAVVRLLIDEFRMHAQGQRFSLGLHIEVTKVCNRWARGDRDFVLDACAVKLGGYFVAHIHHERSFENGVHCLNIAHCVLCCEPINDAGSDSPNDDRQLAVLGAGHPKVIERSCQQPGPADHNRLVVVVDEIPVGRSVHVPHVSLLAEHVLNCSNRHVVANVCVCRNELQDLRIRNSVFGFHKLHVAKNHSSVN